MRHGEEAEVGGRGAECGGQAVVAAEDCTYTACYCEENALRLCEGLAAKGVAELQDLWVAFVSNPKKKVPLWRQRAGSPTEEGLIVWDYHVLCLQKVPESCGGGCQVWDLDTTLSFPVSLLEYAREALRTGVYQLGEDFSRLFRIIPADLLLRSFSSDRSHMRSPDGGWLAEPPTYACIRGPEAQSDHDLFTQFVDMEAPGVGGTGGGEGGSQGVGEVLTETDLLRRFGVMERRAG